jgi:serine/threonine protein kinase
VIDEQNNEEVSFDLEKTVVSPSDGKWDGSPAVDIHVGSSTTRYIIGEEIARGGMGVVHRAFDTQLSRDLAVKILLAEHRENSSPELPERMHVFLRTQ